MDKGNVGRKLRALRTDDERWCGEPLRLEDLRKRLAKRGCSVTVVGLSRYERGDRTIPADMLPVWLDCLDATDRERADCMASDADEAA